MFDTNKPATMQPKELIHLFRKKDAFTVSLRSCFFSFWLFARCFTFYM